MITVKEYAEERGITIQAVHQSMAGKRKKERLEGHVHVIEGVKWLDEEAVAVLDEHRAKNPIFIVQQDKNETIERLKEENEALLRKIAAQADRISELAQWKADNAMILAGAEQNRLALEAAKKEAKILEGFIQDAKAEIKIKDQELTETRQEARKALDEAKDLRERLEAAEAREKAMDATLDEVSNLPLLKKLRWRRKG